MSETTAAATTPAEPVEPDASREFNGYVLTDQELASLADKGYVWVDFRSGSQRNTVVLMRHGSTNGSVLAPTFECDPHVRDEQLRAEELALRTVLALEKAAEQQRVANVLASISLSAPVLKEPSVVAALADALGQE